MHIKYDLFTLQEIHVLTHMCKNTSPQLDNR